MTDSAKKSKELLKGTGIYAIGTFGTKILSLIIVPIYTYYISTSDMGVYDLLSSTISLLAPIITMQISDAAYRWIIRGEGDQSVYIRTTFQVLLCNCAIAVLLIFGVNTVFRIPYCAYFALLLVCTRILETTQKLLRALRKQKLFALSGIIYSFIFLSLNVYQVCILKKGIASLFQNAVISSVITISVILFSEKELRVSLFRKPEFQIIKSFYKYSIPLVPNYLNWWVINSSDRYIVAAFLGISANGILAITHKFPSLLQTILNLFTTSWQDVAVSEKETNTGEYYTRVFNTYSTFILSLLWILIPMTKIFVYLVMSQSYKESCNYTSFYYLGAAFQSFSSFYGVGYLRNKQTGKAFSTSIYGAIVNAVTNIALVKSIGLQASAVSTFIGFLIMWLIRERQNRDELGIRIKKGNFFVLTLISVIVSVASIALNYKINIIIALIGAAMFIGINRSSFAVILAVIKRRLKREKPA